MKSFGNENEIYLPSGTSKTIQFTIENAYKFMVQNGVKCQWSMQGTIIQTDSIVMGDSVYCNEVELSYTSLLPNTTASIALTWKKDKPFDNPNDVHGSISHKIEFRGWLKF